MVTRKSDGAVLFSSSKDLVFKDQFIEMSTSLDPSASLFGLGEATRSSGMKLTPGLTATLWARDMAACVFDQNLYGSHPVYLSLSRNGTAHGVWMRNSNGMDVVYSDAGDSLTYRLIGGVIDLFIFSGPSAESASSQYTGIVGRPAVPPRWSLGFHQCKYGYTTVQDVEEVYRNHTAAGIPLDVVWMDIDCKCRILASNQCHDHAALPHFAPSG